MSQNSRTGTPHAFSMASFPNACTHLSLNNTKQPEPLPRDVIPAGFTAADCHRVDDHKAAKGGGLNTADAMYSGRGHSPREATLAIVTMNR
jgi:hypothetical protein